MGWLDFLLYDATLQSKLQDMAASPNSPLVSVDEYLNANYDPDVEFVDGVLVERNLGGWLHSLVQSNILFALGSQYLNLRVVAELRSSVTATLYRLPDVCALKSAPSDRPAWSEGIRILRPRLPLLIHGKK